ncbi:hypothetical protein C9374_004635 [Naegleria lovaniensis]|uniref:Uncharacterized protein n=1 Tax=Naegleria lovaniensis TaxID=51637 RepID=A0AA88KKR3_NAELO|nr:uncharacterized protein C9374_004635 [Naegleria lovaniensis]KAG2383298.1 hypothetical protein C9374_004635 [Naegleria lovaniensis]
MHSFNIRQALLDMGPCAEKDPGITSTMEKRRPSLRERTVEPTFRNEEQVEIPTQSSVIEHQALNTVQEQETLSNHAILNDHHHYSFSRPQLIQDIESYYQTPVDLSSVNHARDTLINNKSNKFKERAIERQRHIDSLLKQFMNPLHELQSHQSLKSILPLVMFSRFQRLLLLFNKPFKASHTPFDFKTLNTKKEIEKRSYLMSRSFNRLKVEATPLLRQHGEILKENSGNRFQPSCKQRRILSNRGATPLALKTSQQLAPILFELERNNTNSRSSNTQINSGVGFATVESVVSVPSFTERLVAKDNTRFALQEFELDNIASDATVKVVRPGSEETRFSQWRSSFKKV